MDIITQIIDAKTLWFLEHGKPPTTVTLGRKERQALLQVLKDNFPMPVFHHKEPAVIYELTVNESDEESFFEIS